MIDLARVESAMNYLAETDLPYADAKANVERTEILRKRARQRVFLTEQGSVAERNAIADTYADVIVADDDYIAAVKRFEELKARRQRAELVIEVWRTLEATRRKAA